MLAATKETHIFGDSKASQSIQVTLPVETLKVQHNVNDHHALNCHKFGPVVISRLNFPEPLSFSKESVAETVGIPISESIAKSPRSVLCNDISMKTRLAAY